MVMEDLEHPGGCAVVGVGMGRESAGDFQSIENDDRDSVLRALQCRNGILYCAHSYAAIGLGWRAASGLLKSSGASNGEGVRNF